MRQHDSEFNWLAYIEEVITPVIGYADLERVHDTFTYSSIITDADWEYRQGIAGADILDLTGDGTDDLLLYYFDQEADPCDPDHYLTNLYARLFCYDMSEKIITSSQPVILLSMTLGSFKAGCTGIMEIDGSFYLYTESYERSYITEDYSQKTIWYGFKRNVIYKRWEIEISGTADRSCVYLTDHSERGSIKKMLWADDNCRAVTDEVILLPSDASMKDVFETAFSIIGKSVGGSGLKINVDLYDTYDIEYPTAFGTDLIIPSFHYLYCGETVSGR